MLLSNIIEQIITALNVDLYKIIIIQNQIVNNFKTMIIQCDFSLSTLRFSLCITLYLKTVNIFFLEVVLLHVYK